MTWSLRGATRTRCALALVLAVGTILYAERASAAPAERFVLEPTEMRREIGLAWYVTLPDDWQASADDVDHPQRSRAVVREDGRPLGPAHAIHAAIREQGRGAFSHWHGLVYFSTSDGSDPRSNGREYVIELERAASDGAKTAE